MKDFVKILQSDLMASMRLKQKLKSQVLKSLLSDINYSIKSTSPSNPMDILIKSIKKRSDALIEFKKAERQDLLENEEEEISILQKYLPKLKSDQEITLIVQDTIRNHPKLDFGKIMKKLTLELNSAEAPRESLVSIVKSELKNKQGKD